MATGHNTRRVVLVVWIVVAFFYFYLSYYYILATMKDREFSDYLQHVVQVAGSDNQPAKEVRALILVKADELSLPVRGEQITILGGGIDLKVRVSYDFEIAFPLMQRQIYARRFEHLAQFQTGKNF